MAAGGLQFVEQYAIDGDAELAWLITLLPDNPWAHGAYPNPPPSAPQDGAPGQGRYGFATTVEPAVLSAALAAIKTAKALDRVHARLP